MNDLIEYLKGRKVLKSASIEMALREVDRKRFVSAINKPLAYSDQPLSIGYNQTVSQPSTVVFMLEKLQIEKGDNVLEVGCGSGWLACIMTYLVGDRGQVTALEIVPELVKRAKDNVRDFHLGNLQIIHKDGNHGFDLHAPYDKIVVSAGGERLPKKLLEQLKINGKLIMPVGSGTQSLYLITKIAADKFQKEEFPGFIFVPLINN